MDQKKFIEFRPVSEESADMIKGARISNFWINTKLLHIIKFKKKRLKTYPAY
jgi:hypothetical protein